MNEHPRRRLQLVRMADPRPAEADDEALLAGLRQGDRDATATLWQRHAAFVRGVLCRTFGPGEDVDDLLQETFLLFFRQLRGLRDPRALRAYLMRMATSVARSSLRARRIRRIVVPHAPQTLPDAAGRPEDHHAREALRHFYRGLDRLSAGDRTAYVLRFIEGLELTDVADAVGVSLATVKRRLAKAQAIMNAVAKDDPVLREWVERGASLAVVARAQEDEDGHA